MSSQEPLFNSINLEAFKRLLDIPWTKDRGKRERGREASKSEQEARRGQVFLSKSFGSTSGLCQSYDELKFI